MKIIRKLKKAFEKENARMEENRNEMDVKPIADEDIGVSVGGQDPFANLTKVGNSDIDDQVTQNG